MPSLCSETGFEHSLTNVENGLNMCGHSKLISAVDMTLLSLSDLLPIVPLTASLNAEEVFVTE